MTANILHCGRFRLELNRPLVMGILNITPDSFSDGGRYANPDQAIRHAAGMVADGADIIDVGGESTRPNATPLSVDEELDRVMPVIDALVERLDVPVSVDTSKSDVMRAALRAGVSMVNDVNALQAPSALQVCAASDAAVCLMHRQGDAQTMQDNPHYDDVVAEVGRFLGGRVDACITAGIDRQRLVADPGFGFGKTLTHNIALLAGLPHLVEPDIPLLAGLSRKSMLGALTGAGVDQRLPASLAAAVLAVERGAAIVRVHDVLPTVQALAVANAILDYN